LPDIRNIDKIQIFRQRMHQHVYLAIRTAPMKPIILLQIFLMSLTMLNAQDQNRMRQVREELAKGEYADVLKRLDKLPSTASNSADGLYLKAVALDSLHRYESALEAYKGSVVKGMNEAGVAHRISELERGLAERAACTVCQGKGYTMVEKRCGLCQGSGISKSACNTCNGSKYVECPNCGGSGRVQSSEGANVNCGTCSGRGKQDCNRCNMTGVMEGPCKMCKGGVIRTEVKCDLHL
jgi:hypothetical protein